jgi:hypothetical protein
MAITLASGLLAQAPPADPPPAPTQVPAPTPAEVPPEPTPTPTVDAPKIPDASPFDQLRPSQRKLAYTQYRATLAAHELGYYRSHPRAVEAREALSTLLAAKADIPEKAQGTLPAVEAYLVALRVNHGLYDAAGKKLLLAGSWKELQAAARAAAKTGPKGLEPRLLKLKGLLFDAKVDATAPSWDEPAAPAKGKKTKAVKGPKALTAPEGFADQKAITALWLKRTQTWIENTPQEVEVNGEKKSRRLPDPVQSKALTELLGWLEKDNLELLRDPGFGWLDLRRLGVGGLLARAGDIAASKAPEGPAAELTLLPTFEPVLGDSKFGKGEEKRSVLAEVKQGPAPATIPEQSARIEHLGRSRELDVK